MITGKTNSGFEFSLNENALDNMELVDALAELQEDDPIAISRVVRMLLGTAQRKRLYDHLRAEDGRVPLEAISTAVSEIFGALDQKGKN